MNLIFLARNEDEEQETGEGMRKEEPDLLSADMRMDLLRQKWEQQVPKNFFLFDIEINQCKSFLLALVNILYNL